MNTIVENVLREIEFQAGLVLGSFGINADIKSIQGLLNKKSIEPELKALGMWDDPTKFFNTEYMKKGIKNQLQRMRTRKIFS